MDCGGDDVVPAGASQTVAYTVKSGPQVDAVLVELRSPQLGELDTGVPREAVQEGVVGRGDACLIQDEPEVVSGALEVDRDEDERGVQAATVTVPVQGADGQVQIIGTGFLNGGTGAGGQGLKALHVLVLGYQLDLDGSFPQERFCSDLLALKLTVGQPRRAVSPGGDRDVFLVINKVLELTNERWRDAQLHGVARGAIDEGVAPREVEQTLLPVLDGRGHLGNGQIVRGHGVHAVHGWCRDVRRPAHPNQLGRPERPAHRRPVDGDADDRRWTADAGRGCGLLRPTSADYNGPEMNRPFLRGAPPPRVRRLRRAFVPSTPRTRGTRYERDGGLPHPCLTAGRYGRGRGSGRRAPRARGGAGSGR